MFYYVMIVIAQLLFSLIIFNWALLIGGYSFAIFTFLFVILPAIIFQIIFLKILEILDKRCQ